MLPNHALSMRLVMAPLRSVEILGGRSVVLIVCDHLTIPRDIFMILEFVLKTVLPFPWKKQPSEPIWVSFFNKTTIDVS